MSKFLVGQDGAVAIIRFNDPQTMNALTMEMAAELLDIVRGLQGNAGAIVLAGNERAFCAGANLQGVGESPGPYDAGLSLEDKINPLILTLRDMPIPLVTAVRGAAAGVGCAFALMADLIVAGKSAYFLQAFARVGLVPDGGSAWLLIKAVGRVRATEMMMLAEKLPAEKAFEWGLISRLVDDQDVEPTAIDLARRLANGPTNSLAMIRRLAWSAAESSFVDELRLERAFQREAGLHPNHQEGVAAFLQKRPAVFNAD